MIKQGYYYIKVLGHPRAMKHGRCRGYVRRADLIAERALGKYLPLGAVIHHVDGDGKRDESANLVICQDQAYHKILELRTRAFRECGYVSWRKCHICKQYDDPNNLHIYKSGNVHSRCGAQYNQEWRKRTNKINADRQAVLLD